MDHTGWHRDTDPGALEVFLDLQRRMPPGEKMRLALEMSTMLFGLMETGVRQLYPEADNREVFLRVAARHLDPETMVRVYGWDPRLA